MLMLGLLIAADLSWADQKAVAAMDTAKAEWNTCVNGKAREWAAKTSPAEDVATAAVAECRPYQDEAFRTLVAVLVSGGQTEHEARSFVTKQEPRLVEQVRQKAVAVVVKARP